MTTSKFVTKLVVLVVVALLLGIVVCGLSNTANTIISNYLAIEQLENDDAGFIFMNVYQNIVRPIGSIIVTAIYFCIIVVVAMNTYNFIKTRKKDVN